MFRCTDRSLSVLCRLLALCAAAVLFCNRADAQPQLTYSDLAMRMIDLEHLALLSDPGESSAMWSSYSRSSRYDEATGKYIDWGNNKDMRGIIRKVGDQEVLAEMEGPGVIWRIWSAIPKEGHVKIYIDGQAQPAVDLPFKSYFDGKSEPFSYPSMAYTSARGNNLYFPIPYQKSCKITADADWGEYYHFTYTSFPKGTTVPSFSRALPAAAVEALEKVDTFFTTGIGSDPAGRRPKERVKRRTLTIAPGRTATVADLAGPRAITAIRMKISPGDRLQQMAALRRLALRITWDNQAAPAVWSPLGDFFGTAPGINLYRSLTTGMTRDGAYSYWYMPFGRHALIELVNDDTVQHEVKMEVVHAPLSRPFEGMGHFHAKWHRNWGQVPPDRSLDWIMMQAQGAGRFCGVMLHVWNPRGGWWGEGDEKFFVDGEKFPSTFGTGTEDYFGYAWCDPTRFERPFHGQTMTERNRGHQSVYRWQIADNVPVQKSFEGCIEKYEWPNWKTRYACIAYWYLSPGGGDPFGPVEAAQREYYGAAISLAGLKLASSGSGILMIHGPEMNLKGVGPNGEHLLWTAITPGDRLDILLNAGKAGRHRLEAQFAKAPKYGIIQLELDGTRIGGPIDLYAPELVPSEPIALGEYDLATGEHRLTVEITGANDKAEKDYSVGIVSVDLKAAE